MGDPAVRVLRDGDDSVAESPVTESVEDGSPLSNLKARIAETRKKRILQRPVPGLSEVVVKYRPLDAAELAEIDRISRARAQKSEAPFGLIQGLHILVRACAGIYELADDGSLLTDGKLLSSENGEPLTFQTLNLTDSQAATDQVMALYATQGDIVGLAGEVLKFAGYTGEQLDQEVLGNS